MFWKFESPPQLYRVPPVACRAAVVHGNPLSNVKSGMIVHAFVMPNLDVGVTLIHPSLRDMWINAHALGQWASTEQGHCLIQDIRNNPLIASHGAVRVYEDSCSHGAFIRLGFDVDQQTMAFKMIYMGEAD